MLVLWSWKAVLALGAIAILAALTSRWRIPRVLLWTGVIISVAVWVPLLSANAFGWAGDNPVGLGLLGSFGSDLGMIVIACGLFLRLWELFRPHSV
jgi:hypothetical protein